MPRSSFQELKIICIMEYLLKNSDEDHAVTTSQIIAYLKSHDMDRCDRQPTVLCVALRISDGGEGHWA